MTQDMRHDAETFRVAEELMMLSCMATASGSITSGSSFAPTPVAVKRSFHALEPAVGLTERSLWLRCKAHIPVIAAF